ncbi:tetratricopeptide repeat protein [Chloroflexota bacterium]
MWNKGNLLRIVLFGIVIALFGITPNSKMVTAGLKKAQIAQNLHQPGQVADNLATVAEQQPWRSGIWEAAGDAAIAADDAQKADVYYGRAATDGELSPAGYLAWGDANWQAGNSHKALQIWDIAERLGVSQEQTLERKAAVYRLQGEDMSLIDTLGSILLLPSTANQQPSDLSILNHELGLLLAAYDPFQAPTYLSRALEYNPALKPQISSVNYEIQQDLSNDDPGYLLVISGRALANQGHWDLAEKAFENAVEQDPEYAEAWAYLGEARQHTETGNDPLAALEKAWELDPNSISANTFLALYWQRKDEYEIALEFFQAAANHDPENPAYMVEIGKITALLGDLEAGKEYYWQAILQSSNDSRYVREFLKFTLQYNLDLREVALPLARQLVILNPSDPASLDIMGEILVHLGDMLNGERFFLRALAQDMENDYAHLHLGDLYRSQTKYNQAKYHYGRVLETSTNAQIIARAQNALESNFSP